MTEGLLTFEDIKPGIQQVTLNVDLLYSEPEEKGQFQTRFKQFLNSDPANAMVFAQIGNLVVYRTECIVPEKTDPRPPLLLVFGNPASHSVNSEMFFSYEANGREHRVWTALDKAGIISFPFRVNGCSEMNSYEFNQLKKKGLYELSYDSPFRIGFAVYYSMPSGASRSPWAGVAGLYKLLGKKALDSIGRCEKTRVEEIIRRFVSSDGGVIAFQKDAYMGIKSLTSPDYALAQAKTGRLLGTCKCAQDVRLLCGPPTRFVRGKNAVAVMRELRERVLEKNSNRYIG